MKFVRKGFSLLLECLVGIEILICIGEFPNLFTNLSFHLKDYLNSVLQFSVRFFSFQSFSYTDGMIKAPLFPTIFYRYIDSMQILLAGFLTACCMAFLFAYLSLLLFRKRMRIINKLMEAAESVPDLIFILLLQMLVIFIYKKTGMRIAMVVSLREKAVLLPVISIAVPVSFYITKVIILQIEEELQKDYVILAKSKGLSFFYVLTIHVTRNIVEGMFVTSKTIIWSMLSTLLMIDRLFNMNGVLNLMLTGTDSFIIGCMLIFIPFFILYRIFEWVSFDNRKDTN